MYNFASVLTLQIFQPGMKAGFLLFTIVKAGNERKIMLFYLHAKICTGKVNEQKFRRGCCSCKEIKKTANILQVDYFSYVQESVLVIQQMAY